MTVLENVLVGLDRKQSRNVLRMMLRTPGLRRQEELVRREAFEALRFVGLENKANSLASSLAYGDQRRLEIARAMATNPRLLLLDEPAAGMNPTETGELLELIRRIRATGNHRAFDRASHERGDEHLRPHRRVGLRSKDRRRHTRNRPPRPESD